MRVRGMAGIGGKQKGRFRVVIEQKGRLTGESGRGPTATSGGCRTVGLGMADVESRPANAVCEELEKRRDL